jgi:hypothetical protein
MIQIRNGKMYANGILVQNNGEPIRNLVATPDGVFQNGVKIEGSELPSGGFTMDHQGITFHRGVTVERGSQGPQGRNQNVHVTQQIGRSPVTLQIGRSPYDEPAPYNEKTYCVQHLAEEKAQAQREKAQRQREQANRQRANAQVHQQLQQGEDRYNGQGDRYIKGGDNYKNYKKQGNRQDNQDRYGNRDGYGTDINRDQPRGNRDEDKDRDAEMIAFRQFGKSRKMLRKKRCSATKHRKRKTTYRRRRKTSKRK